ncbi:MAG: hypothetical protein ACYC4L_01180 [Chloroflexota bacterium]
MSEDEEDLIPPLEVTVRGILPMAESLIIGVTYDLKIPVDLDDSITQTKFIAQYALGSREQRIGFVRLQSLPDERTLVTLWYDDPHSDEDLRSFTAFSGFLVRQFGRLGFLDPAGVVKSPLGFHRLERRGPPGSVQGPATPQARGA